MKKRIEFYTSEFQPQILLASFRQSAWTCVAILGILILTYVGLHFTVEHKQEVRTQLSEQVKQAKIQGEALLEQEQKHIANPELITELEQLRVELDSKVFLLGQIKGLSNEQQRGFGSLLRDLARITPPTIALTRIFVNKMDIELNGYAAAGTDVPQWVESFSNTESLANLSFSDLVLQRDERERLVFMLRTQPPEGL